MLKDVFSTIFVYCLKVLAIHAKIYGHRVGVHLNIYEKRIYRFSAFIGTPLYMPIRCLPRNLVVWIEEQDLLVGLEG